MREEEIEKVARIRELEDKIDEIVTVLKTNTIDVDRDELAQTIGQHENERGRVRR